MPEPVTNGSQCHGTLRPVRRASPATKSFLKRLRHHPVETISILQYFEEVLYRGLVLKSLLNKNGHSKRDVMGACVVSSAIFGVLHIVNVFAGASVLPTLSQIIHATSTGLFFAAVFLRTKNLWIPILLHGLLNLSVQIFDGLVSPDLLSQNPTPQAGADIIGLLIYTLFITLPILVAALVLLRKVEPDGISNAKSRAGNP